MSKYMYIFWTIPLLYKHDSWIPIYSVIARKLQILNYLRVEEPGHPERSGSSLKQPGGELLVPVQQVGEPEPEGGRLPGDLLPNGGDTGVEHVVQRVAEVLTHDDGSVDGQFEVRQGGAH